MLKLVIGFELITPQLVVAVEVGCPMSEGLGVQMPLVVSLGKTLNPKLLPMRWAVPCIAAAPVGGCVECVFE